MPHARRKPNVLPPWKPANFVAVTLTPEDKERIKAAPLDVSKIDDSLVGLFAAGYKLSLKLDGYNQCFSAYLIAGEETPNRGGILTGRGSTPIKAVRQVLYIHFIILEGAWPDVNEPPRSELDD